MPLLFFLLPSPHTHSHSHLSHSPSNMRTHAQRHPIPFFRFFSFVLSPLFLSRVVCELYTCLFFIIMPWMILDGRMVMGFHQKPKRRSVPYPSEKRKKNASWTVPPLVVVGLLLSIRKCCIKKKGASCGLVHAKQRGEVLYFFSLYVPRHPSHRIHPAILPVHAVLVVHQAYHPSFFLLVPVFLRT